LDIFLYYTIYRIYIENFFFLVAPSGDYLDSLINNISYQDPSGPAISQNEYEFMCGPRYTPSTCTEPCSCTHVYHLSNNAVVDIMVYDKRMYDSLKMANIYNLFYHLF
jgi:hypothetical protein